MSSEETDETDTLLETDEDVTTFVPVDWFGHTETTIKNEDGKT